MNQNNKEATPELKPTITDGAIYRLHHSTLWLMPLEVLRKLIIPAFMMGLFWNFQSALKFFTFIIFIPSLIYILFRYLTLRIQLIDNELIIKSGKLTKNERRIHFDRIQDIEIHQSPLMRLFNVAKIQITTAASDKKEASFETLSMSNAEALKQAFIDYQKETTTTSLNENETIEDNEHAICQLSVRELILGGFTTFAIAAFMAIIGSSVYFLFSNSVELPFITQFGNKIGDGLQKVLPDFGFINSIVNILDADTLGKIVILILFGLFSSIIAYVIHYYDYHLVLNGEVFSKRHGLLTNKKSSIDRNRVQALKIEEKLLQRIFHIAAISVDTAGDNYQVQDKNKRDLLVPVMPEKLTTTLIDNIFKGFKHIEEKWKKVSKQSVIRGSKVFWFILLSILVPSFIWAGWKSLILLPAFPFVYYLNYQWYLNGGYWLHESYMLRRWGWLNRETLYLPIKNIQTISVSQSPFDRRRNLATLSIDTAGQSNTGGGPRIHHLPYEEAIRLQRLLARRVSESDFTW